MEVVMEEKERYTIKDRKVVDTELNKTIYFIDNYVDKPVIDIFNQQYKRIKELEQQLNKDFTLGEYIRLDKENQQLKALLKATEVTDIHNELADLKINNEWLESENQQLKQQLHDLPTKIVGEIKEQLFNHFNVKNIEEYEKLPLIDSLFTAETMVEILDTILKKYGGEN